MRQGEICVWSVFPIFPNDTGIYYGYTWEEMLYKYRSVEALFKSKNIT